MAWITLKPYPLTDIDKAKCVYIVKNIAGYSVHIVYFSDEYQYRVEFKTLIEADAFKDECQRATARQNAKYHIC